MSESNKIWVPENYRHKWLCTWEDGDGRTIINEDREYLCAESWVPNDKAVEERVRKAAAYYGIHDGKPVWMPGRKVTKSEWEDQFERYLDGKTPDWEQAANIAEHGEPEETDRVQ
jgi:hypothetical protein